MFKGSTRCHSPLSGAKARLNEQPGGGILIKCRVNFPVSAWLTGHAVACGFCVQVCDRPEGQADPEAHGEAAVEPAPERGGPRLPALVAHHGAQRRAV